MRLYALQTPEYIVNYKEMSLESAHTQSRNASVWTLLNSASFGQCSSAGQILRPELTNDPQIRALRLDRRSWQYSSTEAAHDYVY